MEARHENYTNATRRKSSKKTKKLGGRSPGPTRAIANLETIFPFGCFFPCFSYRFPDHNLDPACIRMAPQECCSACEIRFQRPSVGVFSPELRCWRTSHAPSDSRCLRPSRIRRALAGSRSVAAAVPRNAAPAGAGARTNPLLPRSKTTTSQIAVDNRRRRPLRAAFKRRPQARSPCPCAGSLECPRRNVEAEPRIG